MRLNNFQLLNKKIVTLIYLNDLRNIIKIRYIKFSVYNKIIKFYTIAIIRSSIKFTVNQLSVKIYIAIIIVISFLMSDARETAR